MTPRNSANAPKNRDPDLTPWIFVDFETRCKNDKLEQTGESFNLMSGSSFPHIVLPSSPQLSGRTFLMHVFSFSGHTISCPYNQLKPRRGEHTGQVFPHLRVRLFRKRKVAAHQHQDQGSKNQGPMRKRRTHEQSDDQRTGPQVQEARKNGRICTCLHQKLRKRRA